MADLGAVMDDLGEALKTIENLRVFTYFPGSISPPTAIVDFPESIAYDLTFGRGSDRMTFTVYLVVGESDARTTRDRLAQYTNGTGSNSVKQAIESYSPEAYSSARVTSVDFGAWTVAAVRYLAASFTVDVIAPGGN